MDKTRSVSATQATVPQSVRPPEPALSRPAKIWRGIHDPLSFLTGLEAKFGDIVTLRRDRSYAIFHPDLVKHVLQDHHPNYEKGARYRAALSPFMGNGLFTSEGEFWLRQRRLAQRAFTKTTLPFFAGPIVSCLAGLVDEWAGKARQGQPVALREELTGLTLRIALRNLFSADAERDMPALVEAVFGVNEEIRLGSAFLPVHLPKWVPTPGRRRFARSLRTIDGFVYSVIAKRKAAPDPGSDLVGLLIGARDPETGERMDDLQLRDELVTMLNAGHDTVTDSIVWTLVLLALNPEARERARAEVERAAGSAWPSVESLKAMEFLGRVFHESLRLYPPGWAFGRTALRDDQVGGFLLRAGSLVVLSPYVTHRSRRFWNRPELFDPDRFLPAACVERPKFAYFPFGSGPRQCIGAGLATMEIPLIVAALLQRFDFELPRDCTVLPEPRISLRPKGTVWLRLRPL